MREVRHGLEYGTTVAWRWRGVAWRGVAWRGVAYYYGNVFFIVLDSRKTIN